MKSEISVKARNAKSMLKEFQLLIQPVIDDYFEEHLATFASLYGMHSVEAVNVLHDYMTRNAKRLRGSFVYYVYKMYGGLDDREALKVALAVELVHSYLLIEDDFMDMSETRRGGPTAHRLFADKYREQHYTRGIPEHFGASVAVTTGLVGIHMAMQILLSLEIDDSLKIQVLKNLNEKIEITGFGQIADVFNSVKGDVTEEDVINMQHWKTGVYTYENPIHLGAILAGYGNDEELKILSGYSIPAGIAFQIRDDILGMFGNTDETGKSNMDDLKEGKVTLLIQKSLEWGNSGQKDIILSNLGNKEVTSEDHRAVQQVITDTGALKYSKDISVKLVEQAKTALLQQHSSDWDPAYLDYLLGIVDYMIERAA